MRIEPHRRDAGGTRPRVGSVRMALPLLLAVAIQVAVLSSSDPGSKRVLLPVSYLALLFALSRLKRCLGLRLLLLGSALNLAAIVANGGLMPITPEAIRETTGETVAVYTSPARSKDIVLPGEETRLRALTDWISIPGVASVASIGDLALLAGLGAYALSALSPLWHLRKPAAARLAPVLQPHDHD